MSDRILTDGTHVVTYDSHTIHSDVVARETLSCLRMRGDCGACHRGRCVRTPEVLAAMRLVKP